MMATGTALVTHASDDGDLEAAQAMRREIRPPSLVNTAGYVCWLVAYLLRWIFYKADEWLIYVRWRWRKKVDYYESIDQNLFKQLVRESRPKYLEIQGQQMRVAIQCLKYYNDRHPGLEYVLASEKVMANTGTDCTSRVVWTHGNFVARQREAWFFSFLYGPPTLFFFEMNGSPYHGGIVTCAPLDEPVNEAYRFLGFPLWWAKRRSGEYDCVCLICGSRHTVQGPCPEKFSCGHRRIDRLCRMCYCRSTVLHPSPGGFERGHQIDAKFSYFCVIA